MSKMFVLIIILATMMFVAMNSALICDETMKWADANPKDPGTAAILLRAGIWCDITGGNEQAFKLYQAVWDRYPDEGDLCAAALYKTAYLIAQGTARRGANRYLNMIFEKYQDQEKWRLKARELWDEVNNVL